MHESMKKGMMLFYHALDLLSRLYTSIALGISQGSAYRFRSYASIPLV